MAGHRFPVRVMVTDAWDHVTLAVGLDTSIADLKRRALAEALGRPADPDAYVVKFRGAEVLDEAAPLAALGVVPNVPFIVLPRCRRPVQ